MQTDLSERTINEDEEASNILSEGDTVSEVDESPSFADGVESYSSGNPHELSLQGYRAAVTDEIEMDELGTQENYGRFGRDWQQGTLCQTSHQLEVPPPPLQPLIPEHWPTNVLQSSSYPLYRYPKYAENMHISPNISGPAYTATYTTPYQNAAPYSPYPNFLPNNPAPTSSEPPQSYPYPSLTWSGQRPSKKSQKLRAVAQFIREDLHLSPIEFLLEIIGCKETDVEIKEYKSRFYTGNAIPRLLDSISTNDDSGWRKLDAWFEARALKLVLDRVDKEMKDLSSEFVISIKDIEPKRLLNFDIEKDISRSIQSISPWTHEIILRAAQSDRAKVENKKKTPFAVRINFILPSMRDSSPSLAMYSDYRTALQPALKPKYSLSIRPRLQLFWPRCFETSHEFSVNMRPHCLIHHDSQSA